MVFEAVLVKKLCSDFTGANWRVHQKARLYNSGSVGQDALPGPLHLLVQIVAIPPEILKWPEKKKPHFYSPPPTHIPA